MVNVVIIDGVVGNLALRFDEQGRAECRWTLTHTTIGPNGEQWTNYWPCCALGSAAERLAQTLDEGQHVLVTTGKLCYRKRTVKGVDQGRVEVLVWAAEVLTLAPASTSAV